MSPHRMPWLARVHPSRVLLPLLVYASLILSTAAQSTSPAASTPTDSANVTIIQETTSFTSTSIASSGSRTLAIVDVFPTTFNVTLTIVPTPTSTVNASASASATSTASATILETKIDPAFSVLGVVLILTGLPSAFLGHKNRWLGTSSRRI